MAGEDILRVAVLVDTSTGWGRRLVRGVLAWVRENKPWHIWIEPRGQAEKLRLPRDLRVEGVIARISDLDIAPTFNAPEFRS